MFKCSAVFERASTLLASAKAVLRQQFSYGKQATPDEMSEVGNQCSICQARLLRPLSRYGHGMAELLTHMQRQAPILPVLCSKPPILLAMQEPMLNPVKLDVCNHIFCR